jgi:hypothetical protein
VKEKDTSGCSKDMPREIHSLEQFEEIIPKATECRVVRAPDLVKLKLRTLDYLYTYRTTEEEADKLLKSMKDLEIIEITPKKESKAEAEEGEDQEKIKSPKKAKTSPKETSSKKREEEKKKGEEGEDKEQ